MKKRKHRDRQKSELNLVIGSQFGWRADDPLGPYHDVMDTWIGHSNPVKLLIVNKNRKLFYRLVDQVSLKWKVKIEVEFKDPNGKQYFRGADMVVSGILRQSDGHYQKAVEEIFAESQMKHYVTTRISAEVIGQGVIRESDFEETAA